MNRDTILQEYQQGRRSFNNLNLTNIDLSNCDLSFSDFRGTNLQGSDLSNARFRYADLTGASLKMANLIMTDFSWAKLPEGQELRGAERDADFIDGRIYIRQLPTDSEFEKITSELISIKDELEVSKDFLFCEIVNLDKDKQSLNSSLLLFKRKSKMWIITIILFFSALVALCVFNILNLISDNKQLTTEKATLTTEKATLTTDKAKLTTDKAKLTRDNKQLTTDKAKLTSDKAKLTTDYSAQLNTAMSDLKACKDKLPKSGISLPAKIESTSDN